MPEVWINNARLFTPSRREIEQTLCFIPVFNSSDDPLARGELPAAPFNQIVEIKVHMTVTFRRPEHLSTHATPPQFSTPWALKIISMMSYQCLKRIITSLSHTLIRVPYLFAVTD